MFKICFTKNCFVCRRDVCLRCSCLYAGEMSVSDALAALRNKRKKLSGCSDELERKGSPTWAGGEGGRWGVEFELSQKSLVL